MHTVNQLLPPTVYKNKYIDGIYVQLLWSVIEPHENKYDWTTLDSQLSAINNANFYRENKLLISLSIRAGANSPKWWQQKIHCYNFTVSPHNSNISCHNITIPQPWNMQYIESYKKLITDLVTHLEDINMFDNIAIIKCSLINQETEELRLPSSNKLINNTNCVLSNSTDIWINAGYHPQLIVDTWINLTDHISKLFNNKMIAIEILENNAFPPIDYNFDITSKIIDYGINNLNNFAVQWDGLNSISTAPKVISAGKRGAIVGWQSNLFFGPVYGAGCYGDSIETSIICNQTGFYDLLNFGINHMGKYLELWPVDIIKFFSI